MIRYLLLLLPVLSVSPAIGQSQATLFEPATISDGHVFGLTISPNGKHLYVVRSDVRRDTLVIYESNKKKGKWQRPVVAPFSGYYKDVDPFFSPDGQHLLFNSIRHPDDSSRTDFDIWVTDLTKQGKPGVPYSLGAVVNSSAQEFYATRSATGTLYFTSNRAGGQGKLDLYVAYFLNGAYTTPVNLGPVINTPDSESNPYIAPDESYLIFFSNRPGGFGRTDLYISYRQNGQWMPPVNAGPLVNTTDAEFCPFVDLRAGLFYFTRSQYQNDQVVREDIFSIPLSAFLQKPAGKLPVRSAPHRGTNGQ